MMIEQTRIWDVLLQHAFCGLSTPFHLAPSLTMKISQITCFLVTALTASLCRWQEGPCGQGSLLLLFSETCCFSAVSSHALGLRFFSPLLFPLTALFISTIPSPPLTDTYSSNTGFFFSCCFYFGETLTCLRLNAL